jgi:sorbitol-specific phosphotransferase system component IIBC
MAISRQLVLKGTVLKYILLWRSVITIFMILIASTLGIWLADNMAALVTTLVGLSWLPG